MDKLKTYTILSLRDLFRLWRSTQHHVVIVAGICLPLLLLLGIKGGFIEEMREDLLASPQGRQVTFWAMASDQYLLAGKLDSLQEKIPNIDVLIPEVQRLVQVTNGNSAEIFDVTLVPTIAGDPLLSFAGVELPTPGSREIVLTKSLAEKMGCNVGEHIKFHLTRNTDAGRETNIVENIFIKSIYDSGDNAGAVGYCDINLIDEIEIYIQGFASPMLGLSAANIQYSPKFNAYLLVTQTALEPDADLVPLADFGLRVVKIDDRLDHSEYKNVPVDIINRYRSELFAPEKIKDLVFYYVDSGNSNSKIGIAPNQIASKTRTDDVVIFLSPPMLLENESQGPIQLLGMDVSRSTWLRNYTLRKGLLFRYPQNINVFRALINNIDPPKFFSISRNRGDGSAKLTLEHLMDDDLQRFSSSEVELNKLTLVELENTKIQTQNMLSKLEIEHDEINSNIKSISDKIDPLKQQLAKDDGEDTENDDNPKGCEADMDEAIKSNAINQNPENGNHSEKPDESPVRDDEATPSNAESLQRAELTKLEGILNDAIKEKKSKDAEIEAATAQIDTVNELLNTIRELQNNAPVYTFSAESKADTNKNTTDHLEPLGCELVPQEASLNSHATNQLISLLVPTRLLGCLHEYREQNIQLDHEQQIFIESTPTLSYGRARIYCNTIDSVPEVVSKLSESGYAVLSEKTRIDEIHATNNSLQLLVVIVGIGVIGFGILTVFSVLSDSTDRKRGTIGVLRVMGVSRIGVFYVVVLRASFIGIAAGCFSILCGILIAFLLRTQISITFETSHLIVVILGALFCSGAGALFPAFKASRLDPFDAIQEGKFH
jgi:ABC-type lipoprotein release transport system permease subunit